MLQPFAFKPIIVPKIWGSETWKLSAQGDNISIVKNGNLKGTDLNELIEVYLDELLGEHVFEQYGTTFPLLFKSIDAQDDLSIQVHPNDEQAENGIGKSEMWYISDAQPYASIVMGFSKSTNRQEVQAAVADNTLPSLLNKQSVTVGDVAYIPAGTVHALCKGSQVVEIQQSSDTTYRLYDYGRVDSAGNPRELHVKQALDVLNYKRLLQPLVDYEPQQDDLTPLVQDPHFVTNMLDLTHSAYRDTTLYDSFVVYLLLEGECVINDIPMKKSASQNDTDAIDTLLIPASTTDVHIQTNGHVKLLEVYVP